MYHAWLKQANMLKRVAIGYLNCSIDFPLTRFLKHIITQKGLTKVMPIVPSHIHFLICVNTLLMSEGVTYFSDTSF